jgi:hypothetical protein
MKHYADSSFLVSSCVANRNTTAARNWLSRAAVPLPFTELHARGRGKDEAEPRSGDGRGTTR